MPVRVVNQTLGWSTNQTINYAYVARKFANRSDKALNVGQYVFMRREEKPMTDKRLKTIVNLTQINHLFYSLAKKHAADYETPEEGENAVSAQFGSESPDKLLDSWTPLGVVATQVGFHEQQRWGDDQPQERVINATIRGRVKTFNVWGSEACKDGTRLYFVLKRVPLNSSLMQRQRKRVKLDDEYEEEVYGTVERNIADSREEAGGVRYCWQVEPFCTRVGCAEEKFREKLRKKGHDPSSFRMWYVGRVSSKAYLNASSSQTHTHEARYDVNKLVTLPMIELFVDPDPLY